jgi:hypothetical protein
MATSREFAQTSPVFIRACEIAGVEPTKRQASKWHNKKGRAFIFRNQAVSEVSRKVESRLRA